MLLQASSVQMLYFCPFCGKKFLKALYDEFFDILYQEYGIDEEQVIDNQVTLPDEFYSDQWWKKRKL